MKDSYHQLNVSSNLTVAGGGVGDQLGEDQGVASDDAIVTLPWWMGPCEDNGCGVDCSANCIQWRTGRS